MGDFMPTTEDVRRAYSPAVGTWAESRAAFDRWLAAHDAEVRAGVVAEEPEWEYGEKARHTDYVCGHKPSEYPDIWAEIPPEQRVRRRPAGPWVPVTDRHNGNGDPLDCPGCGYDPMAPHNGKGDCATDRTIGASDD